MSSNYLDMLNKLKFNSSTDKPAKQSAGDPNILVTYQQQFADKNPEYEIRVRLMFDMQRGDPNPINRKWHQFKSAKDGSWISADCPAGRCPICNATYTVWQSGDAFGQNTLKEERFMAQTTAYLNCYVVSNPVAPEQNGTIKIIKLNKPILEVFKRATSGRDARRFGNNIFRLDSEGNTLVICVKDVRGQGNRRYPNFTETYFADAEDCKDDVANLTAEAIEGLYQKTFNLAEYFKRLTVEEAKKIYEEHMHPALAKFLTTGDDQAPETTIRREVAEAVQPSAKQTVVEEEEDELPFVEEPADDVPPATPQPTKDKPTPDNKVDDLLKEYGIGL